MSTKSVFRPRVIIHGCGNVGQRVSRFCQLKGWEIVAAYNRAGDKVGQDLGRLSGLGKDIDVIVQDAERLTPPRGWADIAVVATTASDLLHECSHIYKTYLSAGINVIVHGSQPHNPFFENPEVAKEIEQVARSNQVTFSGTTIWDTSRVWAGILAVGNCVELKSVLHTALAEPGRQNPLYEKATGFGMSVKDFKAKYVADHPHPLEHYLHGPVVMVLQNLGCTISKVDKSCEPIVFEQSRYSPHTKIVYPAGVVAGVRILANVETEEKITGCVRADYRLFGDGDIEIMSWKAIGTPSMEIQVSREDAADLSAASIFNRIPQVIAARPGIIEIFSKEMGPLRSTALL